MPVSLTLSSRCEFTRCSSTWIWPPLGVNLIALVSRFQTTCCRRELSALTMSFAGTQDGLQPDPLGLRRRRGGVHRRLDDVRERNLVQIQPQLAGHDPAQVQQVVDELHLRARVAVDHLDSARRCFRDLVAPA